MNTEEKIPQGLSTAQAEERLKKYGKNALSQKKKQGLFHKILHTVSEPMFLLLFAAAIVYFILGEPRDGAIMLVFVAGIAGIDAFQEYRTDKTLASLRELSSPRAKVIRDGREQSILSEMLVPGDLLLIEEGVKIPADGRLIRAHDLCVDESSLSGKRKASGKNRALFRTATVLGAGIPAMQERQFSRAVACSWWKRPAGRANMEKLGKISKKLPKSARPFSARQIGLCASVQQWQLVCSFLLGCLPT